MAALNRREARLFLSCALPLGLLYALVNAPFGTPDEVGELARAHALSRGTLSTSARGAHHYLNVPSDYAAEGARNVGLLAQHDARVDVTALRAALQRDTPQDQVDLPIPAPRGLPLPHALYLPALWLSRALSLPVLWQLYLSRIASVLAYSGIVALAVLHGGRASWFLFALGLTPALLQRSGSVHPASLGDALALLFLALLLRTAAEATPRPQQRYRLAGLALLSGCCSPPSAPLALALVALEARDEAPRAQRFALAGATLAASALAYAAWLQIEPSAFLAPETTLWERLTWPLQSPRRTLRMLRLTTFRRVDDLPMELFAVAHGLVDQLRFLGAAVVALHGTLLWSLTFGALHALRWPEARVSAVRRWFGIAAACSALSACAGAYLLQEDRRSAVLSHLDGSALFPALAALAFVLAFSRRPFAAHWLTRGGGLRVVLPLVLLNVYCLGALYARYYASVELDFPY